IFKNVIRNCPPVDKLKLERLASEEISVNSDKINEDGNKTIHSIRKRSVINNRSSLISPSQSVFWWAESGREEVSSKGFVEELIVTPNLWNKILKNESTAKNLKNLIIEIIEKQPKINVGRNEYDYRNEMEHGTTVPYSNRQIRSTKEENLETNPKSSATTTILSTTTTSLPTTTTISTDYTKTTIDLSLSKTTIDLSSIKTTTDLSSSSSSTPYEGTESLAEESEEEEIVEKNEQDEMREKNSDNDEKFKNSNNENNSSIVNLATKVMESGIIIDQRTTTEKNPEFDENEEFDDDDSNDCNTNCNLNEENTAATIMVESSGIIINDKFVIPEADSQEAIDYFDNERKR
ncbi:unnamed protein product, partial [Onchocerca flexuosa]|uniref:Uncharacterized protein n=1 Tax=Onchocerca flexuosa TaxID=387005 RepID=A0A183HII4_9BILA